MKQKNYLPHIFTSLLILLFAGFPLFGHAQPLPESTNYPIVSPHILSTNEMEAINLTATNSGDLLVYNILLNQHRTVNTKVDYYKNGKKKYTILEASEGYKKGTYLLSFGKHQIDLEKKTEYEWFITSKSGYSSATISENKKTNSNGYATSFLQIQKDKQLKANQYIPIGVFIRNQIPKGMQAYAMEQPQEIKRIINENDDVYVFSIMIK